MHYTIHELRMSTTASFAEVGYTQMTHKHTLVNTYARPTVCVRMCFDRFPDRANAARHTSHLNGRSPVCTRMCAGRWPDCVNVAWHTSHLYGRSPVCVRMCFDRDPDAVNVARHTPQKCAPATPPPRRDRGGASDI